MPQRSWDGLSKCSAPELRCQVRVNVPDPRHAITLNRFIELRRLGEAEKRLPVHKKLSNRAYCVDSHQVSGRKLQRSVVIQRATLLESVLLFSLSCIF